MTKLTIDLNNADDIASGIAFLQMLGGDTGAAPAAPAPAPARAAPPAAGKPAGGPAPAPRPAGAAPAPAPAPKAPPAAPAGGGNAEFGAAVQAFAKAYGPKATKARFAELSEAFGTQWTKTSDIPAESVADVLPWFAVE